MDIPKPKNYAYFSFFFLILLVSCDEKKGRKSASSTNLFTSSKINIEEVSSALQSEVNEILIDSNTTKETIWLKEAYTKSAYEPFWVSGGGVENYSKLFLSEIDSLEFDGLTTEKYHKDSLLKVLEDIDNEKIKNPAEIAAFELKMTQSFMNVSHDLVIGQHYETLPNKDWKNKNDSSFNGATLLSNMVQSDSFQSDFTKLRPNHVWYKKFRQEYSRLKKLSIEGGWDKLEGLEKDSIQSGFQSKIIPSLRKRLFKEMGEPTDTLSDTWNEDLASTLKKFQFKHQLKATGLLDSASLKVLNKGIGEKLKTLALNMERMRWLRKDFPQPFIWVDVPKMELDYVENDSIKFNMRVVVGRQSRPTPSLDSKIENIVLSPPWTVPPTIMKEEVVPGIARRGGSYLARRGLKAYRGGRPVNPAMINSKNYKQFAISQAPGYRSSLGEVKFNMINPWAIYLHDTPHREDFVKSFRAYSSGCIRVHKPKEFAEFLLQDSSKYSLSKIDSICKKRTTIFVPFKRNVNVHIVYLTNAIDSAGNVMYLKDVYGWDS